MWGGGKCGDPENGPPDSGGEWKITEDVPLKNLLHHRKKERDR